MTKGKKRLGLTTKIFIGLLGGLSVGIIFNLFVPNSFIRDTLLVDGVFYVFGQGFIRLMKMLVVPLVFCSLICGASSIGDTAALGKVGGKSIIFYLCTTALAVTVAIGVSTLIDPGVGLDMSFIEAAEVPLLIRFLTSYLKTLLVLWRMVRCYRSSSLRWLLAFCWLKWVKGLILSRISLASATI